MRNLFAFSFPVWLCAKNSCHLSGGAVSVCDTGDVWTQQDQKVMSDIHTSVASETLHDSWIISTKFCKAIATSCQLRVGYKPLHNSSSDSSNFSKLCPEFRRLSISFTHLLLPFNLCSLAETTFCAKQKRGKLSLIVCQKKYQDKFIQVHFMLGLWS